MNAPWKEKCLPIRVMRSMTHPPARSKKNTRNGHSKMNLKGDFGELELKVPRDRQSVFDPQVVRKGQTRFSGFDDKIISMYARGMTTREIQGHLKEIYQVEVSPNLISNATNTVMDPVKTWQTKPLDPIYPIVYFDALRGKVRDNGHIKNKAGGSCLG